ncbi:hypothetical protein DY023_16600 [Microbacterium bovistercoris]|uniref:Uncharacterized protein n=1 Tax=Microbacterium bovistercoris TaxID=2293570 RepID=A0A371NQM5_9MICO|nr:hypothetical protein [Microbacterium bovistercoris]REJ03935.1 hypothetical protein DY023_16600 [Microbacterium bovistercoris]
MKNPRSAKGRHPTLARSSYAIGVLALLAALGLIGITTAGADLLDIAPRRAWAGWLHWAFDSEPWWFALALGMVFIGVQMLASPRLHGGGAGEQSVRNWIAGITMATAVGTIAAWLLAVVGGIFWAVTVRPLTVLPVAAVVFTGFATALVAAGGVLAGRYYLPRDSAARLSDEIRDLELEVEFRAEDLRLVSRDHPVLMVCGGLAVSIALVVGLAFLWHVTVPTLPASTVGIVLGSVLASLTMLIDTPGYPAQQRGLIGGLAWFLHTLSSVGVAFVGTAALADPLDDAPLWVGNTAGISVLLGLFLLSMWAGYAVQRGARNHGFQNRLLTWIFPFTMLLLSSVSAANRLAARRSELAATVGGDNTDSDEAEQIRAWLTG